MMGFRTVRALGMSNVTPDPMIVATTDWRKIINNNYMIILNILLCSKKSPGAQRAGTRG